MEDQSNGNDQTLQTQEAANAPAQTGKGSGKALQVVRCPEHADCVVMTKKDEPDASVNDNSVEVMKELGWKVKMEKAQ